MSRPQYSRNTPYMYAVELPGNSGDHHTFCGAARRAATIICAAFSAIITVGELVLPDVIFGMIDASTTRNPMTPRTRNALSTTVMGSVRRPILQVPTGWKI